MELVAEGHAIRTILGQFEFFDQHRGDLVAGCIVGEFDFDVFVTSGVEYGYVDVCHYCFVFG